MDYDIALRLEKTGGLEKEVISLKLQNFSFFNTRFEITQKIPDSFHSLGKFLTFNNSAPSYMKSL